MSNKKFFVHEKGICESHNIGENTHIGAFTHILPGAQIGNECNICDNVFIESDVIIANRVTLKCGVQIWDGITIEDDAFIEPNVTFTSDKFPSSKMYPEQFARTTIKKGASLGANSTILHGITIGSNAMIGAGAVVTRSVPPNAIVIGNPAKIVGYVDTVSTNDTKKENTVVNQEIIETAVHGVTIHNLPVVTDMRGCLSVGEFSRSIPFEAKRYFIVYDVPTKETRGEHAHHECHQFLIAIKGIIHVVADDGMNRQEFVLNAPNIGIYLPPKTWGIQYRYSSDAILLAFASDYYDAKDYIRDYDEFIAVKRLN